MLSSHTLPPATRHRTQRNMRTTSVALAVSKSQISADKISAAPCPEAEPLLDGTLAPVGINANSRFFTNCYQELAANIASGEGFTPGVRSLAPQPPSLRTLANRSADQVIYEIRTMDSFWSGEPQRRVPESPASVCPFSSPDDAGRPGYRAGLPRYAQEPAGLADRAPGGAAAWQTRKRARCRGQPELPA